MTWQYWAGVELQLPHVEMAHSTQVCHCHGCKCLLYLPSLSLLVTMRRNEPRQESGGQEAPFYPGKRLLCRIHTNTKCGLGAV